MKMLMASACVSLLCGITAVASQEPEIDWSRYVEPAQLVDVGDGRQINVDCRGTGLPVVVLEPGFGGSTLSWVSVHEDLAKVTTTCAYDRAGLGWSAPRHETISLAAVAEDAKSALHEAGVDGPFILVGASMGAVFVRQFATQYPQETVGLVLLDPGGPELQAARSEIDQEAKQLADNQITQMLEACVTSAHNGELRTAPEAHPVCVVPPDPRWPVSLREASLTLQSRPQFAEARLAEFLQDDRSLLAQGAEIPTWGRLPLVVLSAGDGLSRAIPEPDRSRLIASRFEVDAELARLSAQGRHEVIQDSSHAIADDHPEAVIEAVSEVVFAARAAVLQN